MRTFVSDKWLFAFLTVLIGMLLYLQYLVVQSTEKLKREEEEKTRIYAAHIADVLVRKTKGRLYEALKSDPNLRDELQEILEAFLLPKYEYMFVIKREQTRRYRFLLDGSKEDKEEFGALFVPLNPVYDRVYEQKKMRIVKQQDTIKGVWLSLLYPIVVDGKTEAMLILDLSDWYGRYLQNFNSPITHVIRYVQVALVITLLFLVLMSLRYNRLRKKLFRDTLTKAMTKEFMHDFFTRHAPEDYHALLVDIDEFKQINKYYGWDIGNEILKETVEMLRRIAPEGTLVIRSAGAEFYLFVPSEHDLVQTGKEVHERIGAKRFHIEGYDIQVTLSVVGMPVPKHTASMQQIQHMLYEALFTVKSKGKNACKIVDVDAKTLKNRQIDTISELIDEERLVMYYQPICQTDTKEIVKYEALVRLVEKEEGTLIYPGDFMDVIRGTSLYIRLSRQIFQRVFARLEAESSLHIAINLDLDDLYNSEMMATIVSFLKRHPQSASRVTFEILEHSNIDDYHRVNAIFFELKSYGARIAVDDFGTGYANFQHLLYLDVDIVKIDGSLIRELRRDNPRVETMLASFVSLSEAFGFDLVAEFVSDETIYRKIRALGIGYAQGYYLGKPQAASEED